MNKWIRNIGIGSMSIAIILSVFLGVRNENSYAVENDRYEDEMMGAIEAYKKMDSQSQQQMLASVNGLTPIYLRGEDIQTTIMRVQTERVRVIDSQLVKQLNLISDGDQRLQELNELMKATQAIDEAIRNDQDIVSVMALIQKLGAEVRAEARESRLQELNKTVAELQARANKMREEANQRLAAAYAQGSLSLLEDVRAVVNSEINVQQHNKQMDMLRFQSLANKRNKALDTIGKSNELLKLTIEDKMKK
ncbi:hypothetical protein [Lederbergia graminis]|uniref:Uncharacterized protein n=1 Tax=Lederbergia graminis TaxID=735518 RepID=A0ABW0LJZ1_9BACI